LVLLLFFLKFAVIENNSESSYCLLTSKYETMASLTENMNLAKYGITGNPEILHNPSYEQLFKEELNISLEGYERGVDTEFGAVKVDTGIFTGRSPKDKYIVLDDTSRDNVWWRSENAKSSDNKPIDHDVWKKGYALASQQLTGKRLFVMDGYCGANKDSRLKVRFIMEVAWQAHFVKNMFIRPSDEELENFEPDFVMLNAAKTVNPYWKEQKLHSEVFVFFNLTERMGVTGGARNGGDLEIGIFSLI